MQPCTYPQSACRNSIVWAKRSRRARGRSCYDGLDPALEERREALFTLGNSYFATRGAAAETFTDGTQPWRLSGQLLVALELAVLVHGLEPFALGLRCPALEPRLGHRVLRKDMREMGPGP